MQHWLRIYSYLQPSFPQRIGMRRLCRLFNAVERLTTENPRRSPLMLMLIPSGVWTTFPNVNHDTLGGLVEWVNGVVEVSPDSAPRLLFLQEGAPNNRCDYRQNLSKTCVIIDKMGCFYLTSNVTDDDVVRVTREHPNLQSLNLRGCSNITDTSVSEVARRCSNLQTLNLAFCDRITDAALSEVARECSNLQSLNLMYCRNITDASVLEVARGCSNLQTLNLKACSNITDASVSEVARQCSNLQTLNLEDCENITDAGLAVLSLCLKLDFFDFCKMHARIAGDQCILALCGREDFQRLVEFDFSGFTLTNDGLLAVASVCPNLQTLNLSGCSNITDAILLEVARRCSNLQSLDLRHCSNITDAGLAVLSLCLKLDFLDFCKKHARIAGDQCILALCGREDFQRLVEFDFFRWYSITDASLFEVARVCPNLQSLNLAFCDRITDAALSEVARECSNLQSLNLKSCRNITDASLLEVARVCPNLQSLNLAFCDRITDAALLEVARGCSNLQSLSISSTITCKNALQQSHPQLEITWRSPLRSDY